MRILRFGALLGSVMLLVATVVSVMHRRADVRNEQLSRLDTAIVLADTSVRSTLDQVRSEVDLVASTLDVAGADETPDGAATLAEQLAATVPGAEACLGLDASGCTGTDLFALDGVSAALGTDGVESMSVSVVDVSDQVVVVVRRDAVTNAALIVRFAVADLVATAAAQRIAVVDASISIAAIDDDANDAIGTPSSQGDRRVATSIVASPFASGSVEVTASVDGQVGFAGDSTVRYTILLALGTVLLAMAAWTILLERRQLERRATTDELTSLINRREFERVSEAAIEEAERAGAGLCVMVIDLNGFKQINDTLGHQFGDLVLTAAAERFADAVRETDVVGRWGGDEFVIMLPGLAERTAVRNSAERIWSGLADSPVVGDTSISASIGAAIFPRHGTTLDALMRAADVAMYEAKTTGVSHRIADTIAAAEAAPAGDTTVVVDPGGPVELIMTDGYEGPDRRRSPVPPPPMPPTKSASKQRVSSSERGT